MSSRPNFSRLYDHIDDSLRRYNTEADCSLLQAKEKEKDVLILLSQVYRKVKSWTSKQQHFDSGEAVNLEGHKRLADTTSILVVFLTAESQYIQHLAGNILAAVSNFLIKYGRKWEEFLSLLWASLGAAILNIHSSSLPARSIILPDSRLTSHYSHSRDEITWTANADCGTSSFISILQKRLFNANFLTATAILRVLRNILKSLKQDNSAHLEAYIHSFSSFPIEPWDLLHELYVGRSGRKQMSSLDALAHGNNCSLQSDDVFLGALLQLFCSMADQNALEEAVGGSYDELPFLTKITDHVPKLLCWCFSEHVDYEGNCFSRYLTHKMLMLMIRLVFHIHRQCSTLVLWLQLLRKSFGSLLYQPIFEHHDGLEVYLEGSPFLTSMAGGEKADKLSSRHLQRQAIFLFFKCSFRLISLAEETGRNCTCSNVKSTSRGELGTRREHCCMKGLPELSEWLHRHLASEIFKDYNTFTIVRNHFALSFLQLYADEDDLLFEMLLLLLSSPLVAEPLLPRENNMTYEEVKGDTLFLISSIFNPIHLFHLFLAELHYDHLVLLDYLISKDTGVHCAQYLLRCLRMVCKAWHVFVEFSLSGDGIAESLSQKRKLCMDGQGSIGRAEFSHLSTKGIGNLSALESRNKRRRRSSSMNETFRRHAFEDAKECLFSLKKSVENLHEKHLFPYKPTALLRSLGRFQELCQVPTAQETSSVDMAA